MVFSLVYVSLADEHLTRADLHTLLVQCRAYNAANDVTGLLLYRGAHFLQFIEGEERTVESLFASIQADGRHHDVTTVRRQEQPTRQFPTWTMAFGDVDPDSSEPVAVEMPPPEGPTAQTLTEAALILELLELFDPQPARPGPVESS